ncbi:hypothetical protein ACJ72_01107 [Emergomyces africanus]|uniref:Uncharacterized protein n=1 Tax=Emergomyces africanus TaxID=1955775 RepID=A0A1B7P647_9EURO|nr:hypothetical protein ACJ72_01107 [Emergomyces africanus]
MPERVYLDSSSVKTVSPITSVSSRNMTASESGTSPYLLYPFYVSLFGSFGAAFYAMSRTVLGYKTWF